jgi:predicted MFS family arabinose efflux permease
MRHPSSQVAAAGTAPDAASPVARAGLLSVLLAGNFIIGSGVLLPAAMMNQLVAAFAATPQTIGQLVTWGAVVLCIGAPSLAFALSALPRRSLLAGCLVLYAAGHLASSVATSFEMLLVIRLAMISAAAVFTPQAAGMLALLVAPQQRAGAVAYVFLGWSLAAALGIPLMAIVAERAGWQAGFAGLGILSALVAGLLWMWMPGGLRVPPLPLEQWRRVVTNPAILAILSITLIQLAGQFALYPYLAAELVRRTGASADTVALLFFAYGIAGAAGGLAMSRAAARLGPARGLLLCLGSMAAGLTVWGFAGASLALAGVALSLWGLGFAAAISMQQARLIAVDPETGSASVALNTSVLYLGQALGAAIGGAMIASAAYAAMGWFALAMVVLAAVASIAVQRGLRA